LNRRGDHFEHNWQYDQKLSGAFENDERGISSKNKSRNPNH
ncbi:MAG: hypothetical protein K0S80_2702, partial [Neobacillus sp.]|nr:hypothetical protein [Neobacillus sp.]